MKYEINDELMEAIVLNMRNSGDCPTNYGLAIVDCDSMINCRVCWEEAMKGCIVK